MDAGARPPSTRTVAMAVTAVALLVVAGTFVVETVFPASSARPPTQIQLFLDHIKHVVVVMMENHAFDSIYGTYCQTQGPRLPRRPSAGIPGGTCVPYDPDTLSAGLRPPLPVHREGRLPVEPLLHTRNSSLTSWHNGSMNGFYGPRIPGSPPSGTTTRTRLR